MISFFVEGRPAPAGSKSAFGVRNKHGWMHAANGRPIISITDKAKGLPEWRKAVSVGARLAMGARPPLSGPVELTCLFILARPKSHLSARTGRPRPAAPKYPTPKPDALKLTRAVEDSLTGFVYVDDAQIVDGIYSKRYAVGNEPTGVKILVAELP